MIITLRPMLIKTGASKIIKKTNIVHTVLGDFTTRYIAQLITNIKLFIAGAGKTLC